MSAATVSRDLSLDATVGRPRREHRQRIMRIVEYTGFPRAAGGMRWLRGFTHDLSESGLCIVTDQAQPEGELLRVVLLDLDGRTLQDAVVRVVWCHEKDEGRHRLGLEQIAAKGRGLAAVMDGRERRPRAQAA